MGCQVEVKPQYAVGSEGECRKITRAGLDGNRTPHTIFLPEGHKKARSPSRMVVGGSGLDIRIISCRDRIF